MQGRVHYYEGLPLRDVIFPIRVMNRLGVKSAIITNAAGGINTGYSQGALVVLSDHINMQGSNPLIGPNDDRFGSRFPDVTRVYWKPYREMARQEGKRIGLEIHEGVYVAVTGPSYETPAEIRMFRTVGADLVGMSTVAEVIAAAHMGMRVLAISCVTNMAAGILDQPLDHREVMETGERVKGAFMQLLNAVIPRMAREP
jgi:purine-nucleoside phosphorylase